VHEDVTAAWERALEQWNDQARHEALIAAVAQHSCYAWAAARYKERGDDPIAHKQLDRLRRAATANLMATATARSEPSKSPYRKTLVWFGVLVALLVLGLVLAKVARDNTRPNRPTPMRH
jgi:hypothetical protein